MEGREGGVEERGRGEEGECKGRRKGGGKEEGTVWRKEQNGYLAKAIHTDEPVTSAIVKLCVHDDHQMSADP